jgi:hypothetical protein
MKPASKSRVNFAEAKAQAEAVDSIGIGIDSAGAAVHAAAAEGVLRAIMTNSSSSVWILIGLAGPSSF